MATFTPPPTSLTCPLCSQLYCLPVTLLCCGLTTCEQCGLSLGRKSQPCGCGVVLRGREDMLYNEDLKMELEKHNQEMKSRKRSISSSDDDNNWEKSRKKMLLTADNKEDVGPIIFTTSSNEYAEVLLEQKNDDKLHDFKTDVNDNKKCVDMIEIDPQCNVEDDNVKEKKYEYTRINEFDIVRGNVLSPSSSKKLNNILVFIDLQKMSVYNESPISQVGCFFDEESLRYPSTQNQDLQFQSFYAVTTPRLQEYNERSDLWSKYFLFDEFYYKHPDSMIRCCPEKTVLETLCQYLAKIKLRYMEVNICVAQNKSIKKLMKRVNFHNLGHIFFPNVDGYVTMEEFDGEISVEDPSVSEHSDVRSKLLHYAASKHLRDNYWDIHKFPLFKGLSENLQIQSQEVKSKALYIGDLSSQVTDKDLEKKLSRFIAPLSVKVCLHPKTRKSLCYAYANFGSEDKAERVMNELQASPLLNKPMRIMYYNKRVVDKNNQLWKSNVFVKNLDSEIDTKRLRTAFSAYGDILSCKVATTDGGRSKCFGFVQFKTEISAWKAINDLHGLTINEKELYVVIKKSIRDRIDEEGDALSGKFLEVRNLSPQTNNETFYALFTEFVETITSFTLDVTRAGDKIGFVSFKTSRFASEALHILDRKEVDGFKLIVIKQKLSAAARIKELKIKEKKQRKEEKIKRKYRQPDTDTDQEVEEKKPKLDLRSKLNAKLNK